MGKDLRPRGLVQDVRRAVVSGHRGLECTAGLSAASLRAGARARARGRAGAGGGEERCLCARGFVRGVST